MSQLKRYSEFLATQDTASDWARTAFHETVANITKPDFPCYFAKNVITKDSLHVAFIERSDRATMYAQAAEVMQEYAEIERNPDIFRVLVLSMDMGGSSWEEDDALLWDFLAYLQTQDPEPWPSEVPMDPNEDGWSFCFKGMPWFFNLNSPSNTHRQSRNITNTFAFVIQRTDGFDGLAPAESHDKLRWDLRARCLAYDGQASSPALAKGEDNLEMLEWIQFHTPNLNTEKPKGKCPFSHAAKLEMSN